MPRPARRPLFAALFLDHPRSVGETYFQHQRQAFGFSVRLLAAGLAGLVHGVAPALFERTASRAVEALHADLQHRAARGDAPPP